MELRSGDGDQPDYAPPSSKTRTRSKPGEGAPACLINAFDRRPAIKYLPGCSAYIVELQ